MKRSPGRLIGLTIALLVMAAGMYGAIYMSNVLAGPGAHQIAEWFALSGCVLAFGFGSVALIIWTETDVKHKEGSWLS